MAIADLRNPILAGRFSSWNGKVGNFVVSPDLPRELEELPSGPTYVQVAAPDGAVATGSIEIPEPPDARDRFRLFSELLAHGSSQTWPERPRLPQVALWKVEERATFQQVSPRKARRRGYTLLLENERAMILEFSEGKDCPSLYARLPPSKRALEIHFPLAGDLYAAPREILGLDRLALATTTERLAEAFLGFLRTDLNNSADLVGERLVKAATETLRRNEALSVIDRIALAHIAIRGGMSAQMIEVFKAALKPDDPLTTPDLYALHWLVDFSRANSLSGFGKRLLEALTHLKESMPICSETVRQVMGLSSFIRDDLEAEDQYPPELDGMFEWLRRLCDAMVWEVPFTTFHGRSPLDPVAQATSVAKKK
ncbi:MULTISPECIES: hypothetical protein [Azospirillum]|uniref:Uncharacterized protein n=2 Tax=Azospirillum brasilense TaxID=192 RepID=A0ABU4P3U9_AZOBR|nr:MULTISPECIES: hypothetical protein [Azospirillum]MDW7557785.1 hypothetical protein [Azospirillum brasilense]MDW7597419.1 hypothetical protein [Azospirillum brasilense]MDW7632761.1 hypothetical protein [Azospirillum brasilense]MDX5952425.1 hypothetical protein [Azospirillum brasilense]TVZ60481.1 hypothetical protein OH82_02316 [Azospirillum brasilense]